jgi:mannose-6-phosphate isomerase-like protein (cupin superfamily)
MQHQPDFSGTAVPSVGARFRVRHLVLSPGEALGPVRHLHSSKHVTVITGACRMAVDRVERDLHETDSADVPAAAAHRIVNHGKVDLHLVEIRIGGYLGDDDEAALDLPAA